MAQKHTIDTLSKDLEVFKRGTNKRLAGVDSTLKTMQPQIEEMHDFIVDAKGFERGQASFNKDGSISISKDVWGLIIKLVGLAIAIAGIRQIT